MKRLPQLDDADIIHAYTLQQKTLKQWGVERTPVERVEDKRQAIGDWLGALIVDGRADHAQLLLGGQGSGAHLNRLMTYGYRVYRDTLKSVFAAPHNPQELEQAQVNLDAWVERYQMETKKRYAEEHLAQSLFDDTDLLTEGNAAHRNDNVDFFVVTGENNSKGIFDSETGHFLTTDLAGQVIKRRQTKVDGDEPSAPKLG